MGKLLVRKNREGENRGGFGRGYRKNRESSRLWSRIERASVNEKDEEKTRGKGMKRKAGKFWRERRETNDKKGASEE